MKLKRVIDTSFDDGLLHLITGEDQEIPDIIEYTKHQNRHFIFYNCNVISKNIKVSLNKTLNEVTTFNYKISYEKKFTSKSLSEVQSSFKIYTRDEKLNSIL